MSRGAHDIAGSHASRGQKCLAPAEDGDDEHDGHDELGEKNEEKEKEEENWYWGRGQAAGLAHIGPSVCPS
jgi:hypothetical protein